MLLLVLILFCVASWGAAQSTNNCPASIPRDTFLKVNGSSCFEFVLGLPQDYGTAEGYCANHGGTLVLVKSQDVSDYLIDQLLYEYGNANKIWIGLSDRDTEGTFEWADGTPVGGYTHWAPHNGPLNNSTSGTLRDCVSLDPVKGGLWEDDVCANAIFGVFVHEHTFICQYRLRGG